MLSVDMGILQTQSRATMSWLMT